MAAANSVLVIGGGFSGMAAAIQLCKAGIATDLVEIDSSWQPLGAGITINGPTLRALQTLGVYERFQREGAVTHGVDLFTATGAPLTTLETPSPKGSDVGGGGGIMRPVLARMLADATLAAGAKVRLGCSYHAFRQDDAGVTVQFTDGSEGRYDLVIGADGVHSKLRGELFPEVKPLDYIGQSIWRAVMPRPAELLRPRMWLGDHIKVGVNPVSSTQMYMFLNEDRPTKAHIEESTFAEVCSELLDRFSDPFVQALKPHLRAQGANIDYRPLANLLVPAPWNRGRVVMIGDTMAATTPHLASGAGIGIESGIVLAEELARHHHLQTALDAFHARRFERCRLVVENSARLCHIEIHGGDKAEHAQIMRQSMLALAEPI